MWFFIRIRRKYMKSGLRKSFASVCAAMSMEIVMVQ